MSKQKLRLGVLTPSSNTALEPLTTRLVESYCSKSDLSVTVHFARFKVTEIALNDHALHQFKDSHILEAADLLADAKVDVIGWSGTAAGWLGFEKDIQLAEKITQRTGIAATTAILALNEILELQGITRIGIVSPYTTDVQARIAENYASAGIQVVAETHENIRDNHAFGLLDPELLMERLRTVSMHPAKPQAAITYCTNLRAAQLAPRFEAETGIPLLDTVSTTVWGMLQRAGVSTHLLKDWGKMFEVAQSHAQ